MFLQICDTVFSYLFWDAYCGIASSGLAVNPQKPRRETTLLEGRGSPTCSEHTVRTAASKTASTTWETTCTWSRQSRTSSPTSSTSNASGKTTLVSLNSCFNDWLVTIQMWKNTFRHPFWFHPHLLLVFPFCFFVTVYFVVNHKLMYKSKSQVRSGSMAVGSTGRMKPFIWQPESSWKKRFSRVIITTKLPSVTSWANVLLCL